MEPLRDYRHPYPPPPPDAPVVVTPISARRKIVHALLLVATVLTTTVAGAYWQGIEPGGDLRLILKGLPFSATLITILLVHESGHYLMCVRHRVSASLPYFLPAPPNVFPLGTFGAFIRIRSRFPDRRALFDIGAAGPWAGFIVAVAATGVGLAYSTVLPAPPEEHVLELGDSLLTTFLTRLVLHADPTTVVLHPIAFAGWFGLFVTSINLLPVGQLDGGHVLYAAAGRRTRVLPTLLLAFLLWLGWQRRQPVWLGWAFVVAVIMSLGHPPTEDDGAPLGLARWLGAVATLAVFVLTFVAEPFRITP